MRREARRRHLRLAASGFLLASSLSVASGCKKPANADIVAIPFVPPPDASSASAAPAVPLDACSLEADHTCASHGKAAVVCTKGHWAIAATCSGKGGCKVHESQVMCDNSMANVTDPCTVEDDNACAESGTMVLACRGGHFEPWLPCRGARGCTVNGAMQVVCDDSAANVGDACARNDNRACASDGKAILRCDGKQFVQEQRCKKSCLVKPQGVTCN